MRSLDRHAPRRSSELTLALLLSGFTSVVAQIVLIRELLAVFYGNELTVGIALACWLVWTGIGSIGLQRIGLRISGRVLTGILLIAESVAIFASLLLVHGSRHYWNAVPGEALAPVQLILTCVAALALFCPVAGWLYVAGARAYSEDCASEVVQSWSAMYLMEAIGSALGGVIASLVLLRLFNAFQIAAVIAAANLLVAAELLFKRKLLHGALQASVVVIAGFALVLLPQAQKRVVQSAWPGFRVITTADSRYGSLAVIEAAGLRSLVQNGIVLCTVPDVASAEEAVHFAALQHPAPKTVLMIGGGLNGSIAEVLRHPTVTLVDYVELDPMVLTIAQRYFAEQWSAITSDPRVHVHAEDGRQFVMSTDAKFDLIIINVPDPQTAQLNRFFTREFFAKAAHKLSTDGVLALHLRGAEEYISPGLAEFLGSIHLTLSRVFPEVVAIPGESVHLIASSHPGVLTSDPNLLLNRLREREIRTRYVREYYLPARMASDRVADLRAQLTTGDFRENRDLAPSAYYFDLALWGAQFSDTYRDAFRWAARIPFSRILLITGFACVVLIVLLAVPRNAQWRKRNGAVLAIAATGLSIMSAEIVLLLGFEALYGYVFDEIALIVAGFMSGMAVGSWTALRWCNQSCSESRMQVQRLAATQLAVSALPVALVALMMASGGIGIRWVTAAIAHVAFPAVALVCGYVGGYQYPIAARIASDNGTRSAGVLYGVDLLGAALGAIALSTYILPVFGFLLGAMLATLPSLGALALILFSSAAVSEASPPSLAYPKRQGR